MILSSFLTKQNKQTNSHFLDVHYLHVAEWTLLAVLSMERNAFEACLVTAWDAHRVFN